MERVRITELFVENTGPFEYRHFIFPDKVNKEKAEIHLFTGENGTGKSTLLLMLSSIFPNNQMYKRFHFENDSSNFRFKFQNNQECRIYPQKGSVHMVQAPFLQEYTSKVNNPNHSIFNYAFFAYSGLRRLSNQRLQGISELTNSPLQNALDFNNSNNPQILIQWIANLKTKEALALVKSDKSRAAQYRNSISRIEESITKIIDKKIEFVLEEDPLNVVIKLNDKLLEFDLLPDGLKSIISWISDLLMRLDRIKWDNEADPLERNFILFLDEIDIHLHPKWQRKILPVVQELFKNAQIFISTHSPFVVGSTDGCWIHKLSFEGNERNSKNADPFLSEDSKSYTLLLNEIFNIHGYFGLEIEKKLAEFRHLRNKIMHSAAIEEGDKVLLKELISFFQNQKSVELDNIIGMEVSQMKKVLKQNDFIE